MIPDIRDIARDRLAQEQALHALVLASRDLAAANARYWAAYNVAENCIIRYEIHSGPMLSQATLTP